MKRMGIIFIISIMVLSVINMNSSIARSNTSFRSINALTSDTFVTRWNTNLNSTGSSAVNQIKLPLESIGNYNFVVDWGDGSSNTITTWNQAETTHTYTTAGVYDVTFNGNLKGWRFNNGGDKLKIIEISQWGNMSLGNLGFYFYGCSNLVLTATDAPDLTETTTLRYAFAYGSSLGSTGNMNNWDVSGVTDMTGVFANAISFNQSIGNWNLSSVTSIYQMFQGASSLNQDISGWDISSVTNMASLFTLGSSFNQPIGNWNTSSVISMHGAFYGASAFNQPIGNWDLSSVITIDTMFYNAYSFNQPIGNWNTSRITNMGYTFRGATSFNQPIDKWDVSGVTDMRFMFAFASSFNQPLGNWNVSNVSNMVDVLTGVTLNYTNYDHLLEGWSTLNLKSGIVFKGGNSKYTNATARQYIIDTFGWTIYDGGYLPPILPVVSSPADIIFEANSVGNEISWDVSDNNPGVYQITRNDTSFVTSTPWVNGTISVNVDGLEEGIHNFTIFVYDTEDNMKYDTVIVQVYKEIGFPFVSSPSDISYTHQVSGNEIQWVVGDSNPGVYNVTKDGTLFVTTTSWTNGTITVNVDGLAVGTHIFIIHVYDANGNEITDTVTVTVNPETTLPIVSNPSDISYQYQTTGNQILWTVGDANPGVYNVTKDGTLFVTTTSWTNGTITVNIDGLAVGSYIFVIHVHDLYGNRISDTVIVTVSAIPSSSSSTPPTSSEEDEQEEGFLSFPLFPVVGLLFTSIILNRKNYLLK